MTPAAGAILPYIVGLDNGLNSKQVHYLMKWNNLLRFTFHNTVSVAPLIPDPSHNSGFFQTIFATALLTAVVQGGGMSGVWSEGSFAKLCAKICTKISLSQGSKSCYKLNMGSVSSLGGKR